MLGKTWWPGEESQGPDGAVNRNYRSLPALGRGGLDVPRLEPGTVFGDLGCQKLKLNKILGNKSILSVRVQMFQWGCVNIVRGCFPLKLPAAS